MLEFLQSVTKASYSCLIDARMFMIMMLMIEHAGSIEKRVCNF